jgi:DNA-binding response OmpR family regulator
LISIGVALRVLVVREDDDAVETLTRNLLQNGYSVDHASTGRQALRDYHCADLVLLDLDLPDLDGLQVCREIRVVSDIPIIAATARSADLDRIIGLQVGLDDYVTAPYEFRELLARIEAVLRRAHRQSSTVRSASFGPLQVDFARREVRLGDRLVNLTSKEFDLLSLFTSQPETLFSRKEIMARVWQAELTNYSRTIDTHIYSLRKKLESSGWIVTVRGFGFRFGSG